MGNAGVLIQGIGRVGRGACGSGSFTALLDKGAVADAVELVAVIFAAAGWYRHPWCGPRFPRCVFGDGRNTPLRSQGH